MENNLLIRFVTGQCTETEKKEVINALLQDEVLQKEYITLKNVWSLTRTVDSENVEDYTKEYQRITRKISGSKIKMIFRYAAVITAIFCAGSILSYQIARKDLKTTAIEKQGLETKFVVPLGQTAEIQLPDGTIVQMNSGTVLSYSPDFSPSNRNVKLDGEAFFIVKKDVNHPFLVKTESLNIKVLGTSFNIEAYNDSLHEVNTTLVSGRVEIEDVNNHKLVELIPGQNAKFNKLTGKLNIAKIDTNFFTSWKNGIIKFSNTPLEEIALKMERWYNVKFVFENQKIRKLHYSGAILKGKPIDQILEIMKITANINYKISVKNNSPNIIYLK